ncbi:hypothetical protein JANAI61_32160 [Jannaschia sp. AI_61]|nr:hypothetical protein JANAI61_32160 [Jannaschia sp. AI_61]
MAGLAVLSVQTDTPPWLSPQLLFGLVLTALGASLALRALHLRVTLALAAKDSSTGDKAPRSTQAPAKSNSQWTPTRVSPNDAPQPAEALLAKPRRQAPDTPVLRRVMPFASGEEGGNPAPHKTTTPVAKGDGFQPHPIFMARPPR